MATTLVLIALPGGSDPRRISVVVMPRLAGAATLADFPDMLGWTQRLIDSEPEIELDLGGQPWSTTIKTERLRPALWKALFQPDLPVEDFVLEDRRGSSVRSAPTSALVDVVEDVFGTIGLRSPGRPPTARDLDEVLTISGSARSGDAHFLRDRSRWASSGMGVVDRELIEQDRRESLATNPPSRQEALDRFYAMRVEGRAERSDRPWPGRPDASETARRLDVHGVLGTLTHHPALLRTLGLVIELTLPEDAPELQPAPLGAPFPTIAVSGWSLPSADGEELVLPRTAVDPLSFLPAPREFTGATPRGAVVGGAIALDPALWSLVQLDVESAITKLLSLGERDPVGGRADPAVALGLPTLRSDGLGIASLLQAPEALLAFDRAARLDAAVRGGPREVLTAAHLTHGYRVDVSRESKGAWHSLHQRRLAYDIGGLNWATEDEGFSTAALAAPTTAARTLDAADVVVRWSGWSLSAPRPYKPIGREVAVDDPGTEPEGAPPPTSPLSMTSKPKPRSLPTLRFGERYRVRLRAVDIGGGGLGPDFLGDLPVLPVEPVGRRYLRYEPVAAPIIVTLADGGGVTPSEQRRPALVIASDNLTPQADDLPTAATASARLLPPKATVDLVERHGRLDDPAGRLRTAADVHALLAARDIQVDRVAGAGDATVSHLCDPLARGIALRGLPGVPDGWLGTVTADGVLRFQEKDPVPFEGAEAGVVALQFGGSWPDPVPLRIRLIEGSGLPTWDSPTRTLVVGLPKGRRTNVAVSSLLDEDDLALLGVWEWLARRLDVELANAAGFGDSSIAGRVLTDMVVTRASISRLALEGGHWALTPAAILRLEHRVAQPIGIPRLTRFADPFLRPAPDPGIAALDVSRTALSTTVSLSGGLLVDLASTGSVVMRAAWSDRLDDTAQIAPTHVSRDEVVGRVEVPERVAISDVLATPGTSSALVVSENGLGWAGDDFVAGVQVTPPVRLLHEIGDTRHHLIEYRAEAMSRDAAEQPPGTITSRTSETAEIHIPASANPDAPVVSEVLPAFMWEREHTTGVRTSVRRARTMRVYLERPWFSSGDGELLAVACLQAAQTLGDPLCAFRDAVSLWGLDPLYAGGELFPDAPRQWSFPEAVALGDELRLPALDRTVDAAGHEVQFDQSSGRWFSDIVLDAGDAYTPFVRLVLVRYQPHALSGHEISPPVVVDHLQLSPDRAVSVATQPDDPHRRTVVITGVAPARPHGPHLTPPSFRNVIDVTIERSIPERGPDFGWEAAPAGVATIAGAMAPEPSQAVLWRGEVTLEDPSAAGLRLVVTERERYRADPITLAEGVLLAQRAPTATRIVFVETIPLGPPVSAPEILDRAGPRRAFTAPLFVDDAFLTSCLNGEATLGDRPSDLAPTDSVRRYQSALTEVGLDVGPAGIDGQWGPAVYAASLAFKTSLDIRTQGGVLDGYAGPRTMDAMEAIFGYARFDEAAASIGDVDLGPRTGEQTDLGGGVVAVAYEQGLVASLGWATAHAVPAPLSDEWLALRGPDGAAGRPTSDPFVLLDAVVAQQFEDAGLVATTSDDVATVPLAVLDELQTGVAGVPTSVPAPLVDGGDVMSLPGTLGVVLWAADAPSVAVPESIVKRWLADAQAGNPPGPPISAAFAESGGGKAFPFADGTLVLAPTGAIERLDGAATGLDRFALPPEPDLRLGAAVDGNDVRLLVGANAYFASLADDLARLGPAGFVYLSSWDCEIDLKCFPGGRSLRDEITRVSSAGAEVAMQLWAADPIFQATKPLSFIPSMAIVLTVLEKVKLKANLHNNAAVAAVKALPNCFAFTDSNHAPFGSHHQKIVVLHTGTELVAYVGGLEFSEDMLLPVSTGAPLFDVSVRIAGPAAKSVLTTFAERWGVHPEGAARPLRRAARPVAIVPTGRVRVQVGHTYAANSPFPRAIRTASALVANAIQRSTSYFYLEDQYFVGDPRLRDAIRSSLVGSSSIGIVVIAAEDSVQDLPDVGFRRRAFIDPIAAEFLGRFLVFEAVGDDGTSTGPHAYVHSKLVLVDDEILVVGSMNSSRRSWTHDSEVMAALVDQDGPAGVGPGAPGFAKAARMDLWSRHLKLALNLAVPLPIEPLPAALLAWKAAAAGIPALSVRPYPPPGSTPARPHIGPVPISPVILDAAWNTFTDPA